jgi:glycosyltransferase involved in cell wall biosynthesis
MKTIVAIDASRTRSGGGKTHLHALIKHLDSDDVEIHVWAFKDIIDRLPKKPFVFTHSVPPESKSIISQLIWQRYILEREIRKYKCEVLLCTDASSVCRFAPKITMSRDMLSFEEGEMFRYRSRVKHFARLLAIKYLQIWGLRNADGVIFLTNYAAKILQQFTGLLPNFRVIPHGVDDSFRRSRQLSAKPSNFRAVYVSNWDLYKHHCNVIQAVSILSDRGVNVTLDLIGDMNGPARKEIVKALDLYNAQGIITLIGPVNNDELPALLENYNIYIFASSCENMPNTLIEGMAAGLPIVCSNRGPMPEILQEGGRYFNPESVTSIVKAIEVTISNWEATIELSKVSASLAEKYSWRRCSQETLAYLCQVARDSGSKVLN